MQFDPATASGTLKWVRNNRYPRLAFNYIEGVLRPFEGVIFPEKEYDVDPVWPFSIQFVTPRTVRIRVKTGPDVRPAEPSLMLVRRAAGRRARGSTRRSRAAIATRAAPGR